MAYAPHIISHAARDYSSRHGEKITHIVMHSTVGTNSLSWLSGNVAQTSIHVLIAKNGDCYKMVDEQYAAHHCGFSRLVVDGRTYDEHDTINCNAITLGIELENLNNGRDPYPDAQIQAAAWWIAQWQLQFGPLRIVRHADIDQHGKTDPAGLDMSRLTDAIARLAPPVPAPTSDAITSDSPLLAPPRASAAQAIAYIVARGSVYTAEDITTIVGHYWRYGVDCGIDPLLAIAQCIHETSAQQPDGRWFPLSSWWSVRPRRNPAGLGVTGVIQRERPADVVGWTQDDRGAWRQGLHFATWEWSVQAHLGRLLAYALKEGAEASAQRRLVVYALNLRRLPDEYRGAAPTLAGLVDRWAVPGRRYDQRISAIANEIMRRPQ